VTRAQRLAAGVSLSVVFVVIGVLLANLGSIVRTGRMGSPFPALRMSSAGRVLSDSTPVDSARVIHQLGTIRDPELDLSIVELGLIRRVAVDSSGGITVEMLLTTPECPYAQGISTEVLNALELIPGAGRIDLRIDPNQRWDPSLLTGTARERYLRVFPGDSITRR
jgi:metal-sulfur cluster biosynthetic enzyme